MVVGMVNNQSRHCLVGQGKAERLIGLDKEVRHCDVISVLIIYRNKVEMRRPVSKSDEGIGRAG